MPKNQSLTMGFEGRQIDVAWQTEDFTEKIANGIADKVAGAVLLKSGVFFYPEGIIAVSEQMPAELQPHAALHETLCMLQKIGPSCHAIEWRVASNISERDLRNAYIMDRWRMFGALTNEYPLNQDFANSRGALDDMVGDIFDYNEEIRRL